MVVVDKQNVQSVEERRLKEDRDRTKYWKKYGPYVAERQWATVREDYSYVAIGFPQHHQTYLTIPQGQWRRLEPLHLRHGSLEGFPLGRRRHCWCV